MKDQNQTEPTPVEQHIRDLLNANIDGEISAAEKDELERLLAGSESVRNLDKELRTITELLNALPVIEPPKYLQGAIERRVRLPAGNGQREKPGILGPWLDSPRLRTGLALAAAVVLSFSVYEMGSRPITPGDAEKMSGTMVKKGTHSLQGKILDSVHVDTAQLNGLVELRKKDDLFTLDVKLNSEGPVELVVDYAGRGLDFDGAAPMQDPNDAVSVRDGAIHLASSGDKQFTVTFRRISDLQTNDPIVLNFLARDQLVKQAELNISRY